MSVKKLDDGRYQVDVRPRGRAGKRLRKKFDRKADAHAWERSIIAKYQNNDYLSSPADKRRLSEFIVLWWQLIGQHKAWSAKRRSAINGICCDMGDPMLFQMDARMLIDYRAYRLGQGVKSSTINHDLFALSGMFKAMAGIDEFRGENPVAKIEPLKEQRPEMAYFTRDEVERLISMTEGDYRRIALLCLATGARWGEAYDLKAESIVGNRVMFNQTKNGERRVVPVSDGIIHEVKSRDSGRLFRVSYKTFRLLMKKAKPNLPDGQAVHALRHTFATHFMMNGGSIITLQRILGHASIQQTMTYAHFSPDYLADAVRFNPVATLISPAL